MRKKIVILTVLILLVLPLTSCKRQYDMTYAPVNYDDRYIWASEKYKICFLWSDRVQVGVMEIDGQEKLIDVGIRPGFFWIYEYNRGCYAYDPETGGWGVNMSLKEKLISTYQPKYEEDDFTIRIPLDQTLYKGKKITFKRYEKDTVEPSDFGFDFESWDNLISKFELVDRNTGETVSWDVLK